MRPECFDPNNRNTEGLMLEPVTECILLKTDECGELDLDDPKDDRVPSDLEEVLEAIGDLAVKIRDEEDAQVKDDLAAQILEICEVELGL